MLNAKEAGVLQDLARQYMELAARPQQRELEKLWISHNTGSGVRPMVLVDQIPWHEMDVDGSLTTVITDPYWKRVETALRQALYKMRFIPSDLVLPPYILLPRVLQDPSFRDFGIKIQENIARTDSHNDIMSHFYIKQFETMEDLEKLNPSDLCADTAREQEIWEEAQRIFEGIAPTRWQGIVLHSGMWDNVSQWLGVEECYYMLLDEPELIHALLNRMTDIMLKWIDQGNAQGLFDTASTICHCSHTLVKPFSETPDPLPGTSANSWTFGMAQLFTAVSPDVTKEFELPYASRLFEKFGNVYYGCCEKLDDRLDLVASLPHVRKVSCSPWSDPNRFAAALPQHLVMSFKANPAFIGAGDMDAMRENLQGAIDAARRENRRLEIILKDISTVQYHPERLTEFGKLALEMVQS